MVTARISMLFWGSPRTHVIHKGYPSPFVKTLKKRKKGNKRQIELWFPLQIVSHEHEGGTEKDYSGMAAIAT